MHHNHRHINNNYIDSLQKSVYSLLYLTLIKSYCSCTLLSTDQTESYSIFLDTVQIIVRVRLKVI